MKLTDTQLIILTRASQHPELIAMPLPTNLRGGAATKTVASMMEKGLLIEVEANLRVGDPMWRETGDGHGVTLMATAAGMAAIGIEPEDAQHTPEIALVVPLEDLAHDAASQPLDAATAAAETPAKPTRAKAGNSKQASLIEMLAAGTTAAEAATKLGWEVHTVRGAIFGAIKKAGYTITSEKVEGRGRVYQTA
jgi:hypothetical protein